MKRQKRRIYISGQISGLDEAQVRETFSKAAMYIRCRLGHIPVSPLKNGLPYNATWKEHMKADIELLMSCDCILMLPNYEKSRGAMLELFIAEQLNYSILECSESAL